MRVLVVEDDETLAGNIQTSFVEDGIVAEVVLDGATALSALASDAFDAVVLDVMLAGRVDGFEVCRELRRWSVGTPVLMLTALDSVSDRVRGLEAGADDYLVKPFAMRELIARTRALTRRHLANRGAVLEVENLRLDTRDQSVTVEGRALTLTEKEHALLELLMHNPGRPLSQEYLYSRMWTYDSDPASNLVEVYVGRLRRKLSSAGSDAVISTVRRRGYSLVRRDAGTDGASASGPGSTDAG